MEEEYGPLVTAFNKYKSSIQEERAKYWGIINNLREETRILTSENQRLIELYRSLKERNTVLEILIGEEKGISKRARKLNDFIVQEMTREKFDENED